MGWFARQGTFAYLNDGLGNFHVSNDSILNLDSHILANKFVDIDSDGDLDLLVTQPGELPTLLRNDQSLGHHWLRVRLSDTASANRDGIGAWIELESGGVKSG